MKARLFGLLAAVLVLAGCGGESEPTPDADFVNRLMTPGPLEELWLGAEDAPVTIIEYASMTCPHCRTFHVTVFDAFKQEMIDTRLVVRQSTAPVN